MRRCPAWRSGCGRCGTTPRRRRAGRSITSSRSVAGAAGFPYVALGHRFEADAFVDAEVERRAFNGRNVPGQLVEVELRAVAEGVLLAGRLVDAARRLLGRMHLDLHFDGESEDPRLSPIDLRGELRSITVNVLDAAGRPVGNGAAVVWTGAGADAEGAALGSGRAVLAVSGPVDLNVAERRVKLRRYTAPRAPRLPLGEARVVELPARPGEDLALRVWLEHRGDWELVEGCTPARVRHDPRRAAPVPLRVPAPAVRAALAKMR